MEMIEANTARPEGMTLNYSEAAQVAGVSRRFLETAIAKGRGPKVVRLGARRLIRPEALARWLKDNEAA